MEEQFAEEALSGIIDDERARDQIAAGVEALHSDEKLGWGARRCAWDTPTSGGFTREADAEQDKAWCFLRRASERAVQGFGRQLRSTVTLKRSSESEGITMRTRVSQNVT